MKRHSALLVMITGLLLADYSLAERVKPDTNTTVYISAPMSAEQLVYTKLKSIMMPEVNIRPPATLEDAMDFLRQASRKYDDPDLPEERRGVNLILKLNPVTSSAASSATATNGIPKAPAIRLRQVSLYDTLKLICDWTGMKFVIRGNLVMVVPLEDPAVQSQTCFDSNLMTFHAQQDKRIEQLVTKKLKSIVIKEVNIRPPATLQDAVDFFRSTSIDDDNNEIPLDQRGVNLVLMLDRPESVTAGANNPKELSVTPVKKIPVVPAMRVTSVTLYDALKLVCDNTGTKFQITGNIVRIVPRN
jgi:hypothetical protein